MSYCFVIRASSFLSLLVRRRLGQRWRQQAFLFFFLGIERKAGWRDHTRGDENDQVLFDVLID
jgi:hypothetical protein